MTNNPDPVALAREALSYLKMEWAKGSCGNMLALPVRAVADLEKLAQAVLDQDARLQELQAAHVEELNTKRYNAEKAVNEQIARIKELESALHDFSVILDITRALIVNALNTEEWHGE